MPAQVSNGHASVLIYLKISKMNIKGLKMIREFTTIHKISRNYHISHYNEDNVIFAFFLLNRTLLAPNLIMLAIKIQDLGFPHEIIYRNL